LKHILNSQTEGINAASPCVEEGLMSHSLFGIQLQNLDFWVIVCSVCVFAYLINYTL